MSDHTDLPCELLTSLLIRGIQMGEMSKLGWLIGLVKHAIWADPLYFLYLLLLRQSPMDRVQKLSNSGDKTRESNSGSQNCYCDGPSKVFNHSY
jgi:hypothetical protein